MDPYYEDEWTTLYLGDCREVLPTLGLRADVAICDPPYNETSLEWDRWPDGWPAVVAECTDQMWCFGSLRMFLERHGEFAGWKLAQDVVGEFTVDTMVWEKGAGSGFDADRFKRVHEIVAQWYRGRWDDVYRDPQREPGTEPAGRTIRRRARPEHRGVIGEAAHHLDGTRLVRSVVHARNMRGRALHRTQKPVEVISPLIAYSCPPGGTVLSPFAGSGSDLVASRLSGRRSVGVEGDEGFCEVIATRLSQGLLFGGESESAAPVPAVVPVVRPSFPETPLFDVS